MYEGYLDFARRLQAFQRGHVVYVTPDCPERFGLTSQFGDDARTVAQLFDRIGAVVLSGRDIIWDDLRPFCVSKIGRPSEVDLFHHGEETPQHGNLAYLFDRMYK